MARFSSATLGPIWSSYRNYSIDFISKSINIFFFYIITGLTIDGLTNYQTTDCTKMKFSDKDFSSKYEQMSSVLYGFVHIY